MCIIIIARASRLEQGSRFARIGINAQDEKFGRDRSKIHHAIDQGFRCVLKRDFELWGLVSGRLRLRHKYKIDGFIHLVFHGIEGDDARLTDSRRDTAHDVQATVPMPRHVEARFKAGQARKTRQRRNGIALPLIGSEIKVQSALRHIGDGE